MTVDVVSGEVFCRSCGSSIKKEAEICVKCGVRQLPATNPNKLKKNYKKRTTAAILALFLGAFGVHKFYLGQKRGLFYLFFFWTLVPSIIALVEAIIFFTQDDETWDLKYNQ